MATIPAASGLIKKLTRHGNSLALVIDKPVLEAMGLDENTPVLVALDGKNMLVTRASEPAERRRFEKSLAKVNRQWGDVLKRLAE